jgi:murein DD-endopeptidase MepM/ murein hydrolase activator NlpD
MRTYLGSADFRWRMLVTTSRYTSHIAVIVVALIATLLATANLGGKSPAFEPEITLSSGAVGSGTGDQVGAGSGRIYSPAELQNYLSVLNQDSGVLSRRAIAETSAPVETRSDIITYTVQAGDTIETIAARFKLLPSTLVWSNQEVEDQPDQLSIGQTLYILPVDGIWYEVQSSDTLDDIADKYKVKPEDIVNYPLNNLSGGANLLAGTKIVIPNGVKAAAATAVASSSSGSSGSSGGYASYGSAAAVNPAASGNFMWPTGGSLTQYFGIYHSGIDIAYAVGVPIMAADGGYVSYAGWDNTGYGYEVLINHGNGFSTRYAHLSQYYVDAGQPVARGQVIAAMGSTGNSTGPHLHFEVIYGGVPQNPLFYLP